MTRNARKRAYAYNGIVTPKNFTPKVRLENSTPKKPVWDRDFRILILQIRVWAILCVCEWRRGSVRVWVYGTENDYFCFSVFCLYTTKRFMRVFIFIFFPLFFPLSVATRVSTMAAVFAAIFYIRIVKRLWVVLLHVNHCERNEKIWLFPLDLFIHWG